MKPVQSGRPSWERLFSTSMRQGMVLVLATTVALGLDYVFNLAAGRLLEPAEFGIVVSLAALVQVLVVASRVVQTIVTRYVARFRTEPAGPAKTAAFFRQAYRASWRWGSAAMLLLALLSVPITRFLRIEGVGPVLAVAVATMLLALRPVVGGVLLGQQRFAVLGAVQVLQAAARLVAGILLMAAGLGALGAMAALPLAAGLALIYGLFSLRETRAQDDTTLALALPDLARYSAYTAAGLIGFAFLVNMDALLVKRFFAPAVAGQYGAAVTLGKVVQFFPLAIIMILFPKAADRQARRRSPARVLAAALLIVALFCGAVTLLYFWFPDRIVDFVFGPAYRLEGPVLGLLGLAMLFLSLGNVWLNFFLSIEETGYVYLIWLGVVAQGTLIVIARDTLWHIPAAMAANGLWLALAGGAVYWRQRRRARIG